MGVEHSSYTYVGEYFEDVESIACMFIEQGLLVLDTDDSVEDFDSDVLMELSGLDITCENCYTGEGYYVGFEAYDWKHFQQLLDEYKKITGREGDVHNFVKVH